jgi:Putative alpha-1,2-mannosidase
MQKIKNKHSFLVFFRNYVDQMNKNYKEMKTLSITQLVFFLFFASHIQGNNKNNHCYYVDPFIGTASTGHTFPGATYPFGFMQPGPQTGAIGWEYCGGYFYEDSLIWGFSQNRINGTGIPDLGDILLMPYSGTPRDDFKSTFSKETEKASPGYYTVELIDNSVKVDITCTQRVAFHRYTFREESPSLYINFQNGNVNGEDAYNTHVLSAGVKVEDNYTITGHHQLRAWVDRQLFYVIKFDVPLVSKKEIKADDRNEAPRYIFSFDLKKGKNSTSRLPFQP